MKTFNTITKTSLTVLLAAFFSVFTMNLNAQEEEKIVKIKVVKEIDGKTTLLDTTLNISDIEDLEELEGLDIMIGDELIEDLDIKLKELDENENVDVKVMTQEKDGDTETHTIIVRTKIDDEEGKEGEVIETIDLIVDVEDEDTDGKVVKLTLDGESHVVYVTEGEDVQKIETEDGKTIILKKTTENEEDIMIMDGDVVNWEGEMNIDVEVEDYEGGHKVSITDEKGELKEYLIEGREGAYFIDEDGNVNEIDGDNNIFWNNDSEGIFVNIEDGSEANVIIVGGSYSEELDNGKNIFIHKDNGTEDKEVFVEVIRKQDGEEVIEIKSKVIIVSLNEEDTKKLENAGIKVTPVEDENDLEVKSLKFYPNPTDGKFHLKFSIEEKGTTIINIYDVNGKKVYNEKLKNFEGQYDQEIDLSEEQKGTYFLHIQQGDKISTRKIVLD